MPPPNPPKPQVMKPLSPRSEIDRSYIILERLIEAKCLPTKYLSVLRSTLEEDERDLSAPATPTPEEAAAVERDKTLEIPDVPIPGLRRKRADDSPSEEEVKRRCAKPHLTPLPQREPRPERPQPPPKDQQQPSTSKAASYASAAGAKKVPSPTLPTLSATPPPPRPHSPEGASNSDKPTAAIKPRYPPLVVEVLPNWATHFRALKERLGHPPNARPYGKGVRFSPATGEEYRTVQAYLTTIERTEKVVWFSYALPEELNLKVAIRGLPADTPTEEIEGDLRRLGFEPEAIRAVRPSKGRPGCIFFGTLKKTPNLTPDIYNVTELLNMPGVVIESWRGKKGPAQCHRCQAFRHSSHNCHRPLACVRCGGPHFAGDCPRPREMPPTCINCEGAHTANNKTCPVYKKEARNKRAGTTAHTTASAAPHRGGRRERSANSGAQNPALPQTQTQTRPPAPYTPLHHTVKETAGQSLMAPANNPQTGKATKKRRRRTKRVRVTEDLSSSDSDAPPSGPPQPPRTDLPAVIGKRTPRPGALPTPAPQEQEHHPLSQHSNPQPPPPQQPKRRGGKPHRPAPLPPKTTHRYDSDRLELLDTALQILQEVLQTLRTGGDPIPIVLSGIGKLFKVGS